MPTPLANARILLIGAGALGNEIIKNLALLGAGAIAIVDHDHIEAGNLSRSVLYRSCHVGQPKAHVAADAARGLAPELHAIPLPTDVAALGLAWFRHADLVIAAVDNRLARLHINTACALAGTPWIDGGIDATQGIARLFAPPRTACYECTMSDTDWRLLPQATPCPAPAGPSTPTTPITASVTAAVQVQTAIEHLQGRHHHDGQGWLLDLHARTSCAIDYPVDPACPRHTPPVPPIPIEAGIDTPLARIWRLAASRLGAPTQLHLGLTAPRSPHSPFVWRHTIGPDDSRLGLTPQQLDIPPMDVIWASRYDALHPLELTHDGTPFADARHP